MAYRISYGPAKKKRDKKRWIFFLSGLIVLLFGAYFLQKKYDLFLPGDPAVTALALDHMASAISKGESFSDAFFCFCQEIIDGANLPY